MKMMRSTVARLAVLLPLALAACGSASTTVSGTLSPPAAAQEIVHTGAATVTGASKTVLTNVSGMTLYYRTADNATTIGCTGGCASVWPPLLLASGTPAGSAAVTGAFTTLDGANGRQVLYNGHPLYNYSKDTKPGDATGEGVGGVWHVATPDLT
jgi:predicted lipoprotein with Yx(FWY)xxD motif